MSKKIDGALKYTAKDCRKKNKQVKRRCNYIKITEAIGQINIQIKMSLACGETKIRIGRILDDSMLPVLIFTYDWEQTDSVHLSDPEWFIIAQQLNDAGFTVNINERAEYINLSWEEK